MVVCRELVMNGISITALVKQQVIIPHSDFPNLLTAHLNQSNRGPNGTIALESRGFALRTSSLSSQMTWAGLDAFIKDVCRWGDYAGISGRVLKSKNNARAKIEGKVGNAILQLNSTPPDIVGALRSMMEIKGLGVSFASKHLRFLFPEYCPVLDSILSSRLFYELSADDYGRFAAACRGMADELNSAKIESPLRKPWRPSDVEAALYAWINEWK
jgi:hypothetical protein